MKFEGCYTALATPFSLDGVLDEEAYRRMIHRQMAGGVAGLVPCGSTGEAATLLHEEYRHAISVCVQEARGKIPVIAGVGSNSTAKAVALAKEAADLGAHALLVLAPYYNKPTQEGIILHFKAIAAAVRLPLMAYNIPGRTAVNILPKTLARMAREIPSVVAVKEASGSVDQIGEVLSMVPHNFSVLSGDDALTLPLISIGAKGVVSVLSNVAPRQMVQLCAAALKGDLAHARAIHLKSQPLIKALFIETNPIPVKAALEMMHLCRGEPRLPLTPLSAEHRPALKAALKSFGLL